MDLASKLNQTATYWAPGTPDGYGRTNFEAVPVEISVRWQDTTELYRDTKGNEQVSSSVIYMLVEIAIGGYIKLGNEEAGTVSDPRQVSGAQEVRQIGTSPSLRATQTLYRVIV